MDASKMHTTSTTDTLTVKKKQSLYQKYLIHYLDHYPKIIQVILPLLNNRFFRPDVFWHEKNLYQQTIPQAFPDIDLYLRWFKRNEKASKTMMIDPNILETWQAIIKLHQLFDNIFDKITQNNTFPQNSILIQKVKDLHLTIKQNRFLRSQDTFSIFTVSLDNLLSYQLYQAWKQQRLNLLTCVEQLEIFKYYSFSIDKIMKCLYKMHDTHLEIEKLDIAQYQDNNRIFKIYQNSLTLFETQALQIQPHLSCEEEKNFAYWKLLLQWEKIKNQFSTVIQEHTYVTGFNSIDGIFGYQRNNTEIASILGNFMQVTLQIGKFVHFFTDKVQKQYLFFVNWLEKTVITLFYKDLLHQLIYWTDKWLYITASLEYSCQKWKDLTHNSHLLQHTIHMRRKILAECIKQITALFKIIPVRSLTSLEKSNINSLTQSLCINTITAETLLNHYVKEKNNQYNNAICSIEWLRSEVLPVLSKKLAKDTSDSLYEQFYLIDLLNKSINTLENLTIYLRYFCSTISLNINLPQLKENIREIENSIDLTPCYFPVSEPQRSIQYSKLALAYSIFTQAHENALLRKTIYAHKKSFLPPLQCQLKTNDVNVVTFTNALTRQTLKRKLALKTDSKTLQRNNYFYS